MTSSTTIGLRRVSPTFAAAAAALAAFVPPEGYAITYATVDTGDDVVSVPVTAGQATSDTPSQTQADTIQGGAAEMTPRKPRSDKGVKRTETPVADATPPVVAETTPAVDVTAPTTPSETVAPGADAPTHDDARSIAQAKMKALAANRDAIAALIKGTGVEALGKIPQDKLAGFVEALNALPEGA